MRRILIVILLATLMGGSITSLGSWAAEQDDFQETLGRLRTMIREQRFEEASDGVAKAMKQYDTHMVVLRNLLALCHLMTNSFQRADHLTEIVLTPSWSRNPEDHGLEAQTLMDLGRGYVQFHDYEKAARLFEKAALIRFYLFGPQDDRTEESLEQQALALLESGRVSQAQAILGDVLTGLEKRLGEEDPALRTPLRLSARAFLDAGKFDQAEKRYIRALAISEKAHGPRDPETTEDLRHLAMFYRKIGRFADAEKAMERALSVDREARGPQSREVAEDLTALAELFWVSGDYARAVDASSKALETCEAVWGKDHPKTVVQLQQLAKLKTDQDDYAPALRQHEEVLERTAKVFGPKSWAMAQALSAKASFHSRYRDYVQAEELLKRSLKLIDSLFGANHPLAASCLDELSVIYLLQGDYSKALPFGQQALKVFLSTRGPDHAETAVAMTHLGALHLTLGDIEDAGFLLNRARDILSREVEVHSSFRPDFAEVLFYLGGLSLTLGDTAEALERYEKALELQVAGHGEFHPKVAQALYGLAETLIRLGRKREALTMLVRAQAIDAIWVENVFSFSSQGQQLGFLDSKSMDLGFFLLFVAENFKDDPGVVRSAFEIWVRRKGVALEAQKRFREALVDADAVQVRDTFRHLAHIRNELSKLAFARNTLRSNPIRQTRVDALEKKKEELEARLCRLSSAYSTNKKVTAADTESLAQALPKDAVLLEFAAVRTQARARYLCFVLQPEKGAGPKLVDLGPAEALDQVLAELRETTKTWDAAGVKIEEVSRRLFDLIFVPLQGVIGRPKKIFVSPDAQLNLVPFEILKAPDRSFLIEHFVFNYLVAGRDILGFSSGPGSGGRPLFMGDPDFNTVGQKASPGPGGPEVRAFQGISFGPLPGTREEVTEITRIFGRDDVDLKLGSEASEPVLFSNPAPRILHLATHGFFIQDWEHGSDPSDRRAPAAKAPVQDNPLLRSGFALAGANTSLQMEIGGLTGIVTAEKVLGLELRGTDLVVLSACESGLGVVQSGEGVFGLRRAFFRVGARSMVMSLWPVPDLETKELMVRFYQNYLTRKMTMSQALHEAALHELEIVKARHGTDNPMLWGGFVFIGNPI